MARLYAYSFDHPHHLYEMDENVLSVLLSGIIGREILF